MLSLFNNNRLAFITQAITDNQIRSNLKSVNSIDGWISPIESVLSWAPFLRSMGFVDEDGHDRIMRSANATRDLLNAGKFAEATTQWSITEAVIYNVSGPIDFYNVMNRLPMAKWRTLDTETNDDEYRGFDDRKLNTLMNGPVRRALNISKKVVWGKQSGKTFVWLRDDFMKPATHFGKGSYNTLSLHMIHMCFSSSNFLLYIVELLLNETSVDVSIITGQLDLIVATPGTLNWVNRIR